MVSYTTQNGEPVRLGALIASKGEGAVYPVLGPGKLAAKIYHTVPPPSKLDKLRAMARMADPGILGQTAWPLYPIYSGDRRLAGFVMPPVEGHKEIHLLYGPASRMSDFPDARWEFLVQVAANVARAFAGLHEKRIVVGDVNQGGILVAQNGTVRVIDCDSFQFEFQGRVFPCEVGVPDFTPPELQGVPFGRVVRSSA